MAKQNKNGRDTENNPENSARKSNRKGFSILLEDQIVSESEEKEKHKSLLVILPKEKGFKGSSNNNYPLENLIAICFLIALKEEFKSFENVENYVSIFPNIFIKLGLVKKGCYPSEQIYQRTFECFDNKSFRNILINWLPSFFAKASNAFEKDEMNLSTEAKRNSCSINLSQANNGAPLLSVSTESRTSDISLLQRLLELCDLKNTIIIANSCHLEEDACDIIVEKKGDYCFPVKGNQPVLLDKIKKVFPDSKRKRIFFFRFGKDYEILPLKKGDFETEWSGAKSVAMTTFQKKKDVAPSSMYFLTSLTDKEEIAEAVQRSWDIENGTYRFNDAYLDEDQIKAREKKALANRLTMNNVVYSLYRIVADIIRLTPADARIIYRNKTEKFIKMIYPLSKEEGFTELVKQKMRGTKESKKN